MNQNNNSPFRGRSPLHSPKKEFGQMDSKLLIPNPPPIKDLNVENNNPKFLEFSTPITNRPNTEFMSAKSNQYRNSPIRIDRTANSIPIVQNVEGRNSPKIQPKPEIFNQSLKMPTEPSLRKSRENTPETKISKMESLIINEPVKQKSRENTPEPKMSKIDILKVSNNQAVRKSRENTPEPKMSKIDILKMPNEQIIRKSRENTPVKEIKAECIEIPDQKSRKSRETTPEPKKFKTETIKIPNSSVRKSRENTPTKSEKSKSKENSPEKEISNEDNIDESKTTKKRGRPKANKSKNVENNLETSEVPEIVDRKRKRYSTVNVSRKSIVSKSESSLRSRRQSVSSSATIFSNSDQQDWQNFKDFKCELYVMGMNEDGQLGLGENVESVEIPKKVDFKQPIKQVVTGALHTLILTHNGQVYSCGSNDECVLGRKTSEDNEKVFKTVEFPNKEKISKIVTGDSFSAALTTDGDVFAWGLFRLNTGPIGLMDGQAKDIPVKIGDQCSNISAGSNHLLLLKEDGRVFSCGSGEEGQLGRITERVATSKGGRHSIKIFVQPGEVFFKHSFKTLKFDFSKRIVKIFTGKNSSFALTNDGHLYAWGLNKNQELGDYDDFIYHPILINFEGCDIEYSDVYICGGNNFNLILNTKTKILYSVGNDMDPVLGRDKQEDDHSVKPVDCNTKFVACAAGDSCSFAIDENNKLWSWGFGENYQLGFDSDQDVARPRLVESLSKLVVKQVSAGSQHTAVLCCN